MNRLISATVGDQLKTSHPENDQKINPLKVVWLCHFANNEMKSFFNTPKLNEFAPWISILIKFFEERNLVDLHIVAPNVFTNADCNFEKKGIKYHFFKHVPIPFFNSYILKVYSILRIERFMNYSWIKFKISHLINNINPDIIHLHGAENPYYSAGILTLIGKYSVITTIQGFIRHTSSFDSDVKQRIKIEEEIIRKCKHFGTRTETMNKVILEINPSATLHFHNYPIEIPTVVKNNIGKKEQLSLVFFARVTKDKGIEDLLRAISIVKVKMPSISLSVIGGVGYPYLVYLKKLCVDLEIESNVNFLGFLSTQNEIYKYALNAKICVLPTYHDIIPGTIIESMFMKLPVIAYAVGGIPEINSNEEVIKLVEKHNIHQLANSIVLLLENDEIRKTLAEKAFIYANERFNNDNVVVDMINAYNIILNAKKSEVASQYQK